MLGTGLAYVATGTLSGRVGSTRASVITYLATPVAMTFGVLFRGDCFAPVAVGGRNPHVGRRLDHQPIRTLIVRRGPRRRPSNGQGRQAG